MILIPRRTQRTNTWSRSTKDILEQDVNYFQTWQARKTSERYHWSRSDVFIANFEHIPHRVLVFLLRTLTSVEQNIKLEKNCCCFIFGLKNVNCFCQFLMTLRTKFSLTADAPSLTVLPWDSRLWFESHGLMVTHKIFTLN